MPRNTMNQFTEALSVNRPCSRAVVCPGPQPGLEADSPVTNYSSEYNDGVEFVSYPFPPGNPYDPRIPKWWADSCVGIKCVSMVSQQAADDCAAALQWLCVVTPPRDPEPPTPCIENPELCIPTHPEMFQNQTQSASFACPDGTLFYWTVQAGTIYSQSVAQANAVALALAQKRVSENFICFSALTNQPCLDTEYTDIIVVDDGNFQSYTFSVIAGDLPPGLTLTDLGGNQASITGTALFSGTYAATIRATASNGNFADKTYTFSVIGLTNPSQLTEATIGQAYSEQLVVDGGVSPFSYSVVSGVLPSGLTLNSTGLISGTPLDVENASFTIEFSDSNGATCRKAFTLQVICLISTVSLPNGTDGEAYSQTLTANGGSAPFVWSIIAGALPSGLSLNASTGSITGTPDTVETANFTVQLLTQEITCQKELSIQIEAAPAIDWNTLNWYQPFTDLIGPGSGTQTLDPSVNPTQQANFNFEATASTTIDFFPTISTAANEASLTYNGGAVNCNLHVTNGDADWSVIIFGDNFGPVNCSNTPGISDWPFTVPDTGGNPITITVQASATANASMIASPQTARVTGVFSNV